MIAVRILRGCVAELATRAAGDVVEVSDNVARFLIGAGKAEMAAVPPAPAPEPEQDGPRPQPQPHIRPKKQKKVED